MLIGTPLIAFIIIDVIVGKIITAKTTAPDNKPNPVPPYILRTTGTININPKKPYTTDGIPVNKSNTICKMSLTRFFAY